MKIKHNNMVYDAVLLPNPVPSKQVSCKVSSDLIKACVGDCNEQLDCRITVEFKGGTLLATHSYYDSNGHLVVEDNNGSKYQATCRKCWKSWNIEQYSDRG
jgi:hypothetical protein